MIMYTNELYHHGILGQKWGVRRYQNPDGTLTKAGERRRKTGEDYENEASESIKFFKGKHVAQYEVDKQRKRNKNSLQDKANLASLGILGTAGTVAGLGLAASNPASAIVVAASGIVASTVPQILIESGKRRIDEIADMQIAYLKDSKSK